MDLKEVSLWDLFKIYVSLGSEFFRRYWFIFLTLLILGIIYNIVISLRRK